MTEDHCFQLFMAAIIAMPPTLVALGGWIQSWMNGNKTHEVKEGLDINTCLTQKSVEQTNGNEMKKDVILEKLIVTVDSIDRRLAILEYQNVQRTSETSTGPATINTKRKHA